MSLRGGGAKFPNPYLGAFGPTVGNSLERKTLILGTPFWGNQLGDRTPNKTTQTLKVCPIVWHCLECLR
jgi:hypothetical protein